MLHDLAVHQPALWKKKAMKETILSFLLAIGLSMASCTTLHANDFCNGPKYPDQFPFGCAGIQSLQCSASSVQILEPNASGLVQWEGGRSPYHVQISGEGFYINSPDSTGESVDVTGISIVVHSGSNSCGTATVIVSDGCSQCTHYIRSTIGVWGPPAGIAINSSTDCVITGSPDSRSWNGYGWVMQGVRGKYMQEIYDYPYGYSASTTASCLSGDWAPTCLDEESYLPQDLLPFCREKNNQEDQGYNLFCFSSGEVPVTRAQFDDPNTCCNAFHPRPPQFIRCWQARIRRYYEWICHY